MSLTFKEDKSQWKVPRQQYIQFSQTYCKNNTPFSPQNNQNTNTHKPIRYKTHTCTHPHITKPTHTHTLENQLKEPHYKTHTKLNRHNTNQYLLYISQSTRYFCAQQRQRNSLQFTSFPNKITSLIPRQFTRHHYTSHHFTW